MLREGEISVRLGLHCGRIDSVDIRSTRSPLPERFTRGRDVDEVVRTLPLLYSICAHAQGAAAAAALDAACGTAVDAAALSWHSHAVRDEIVIELFTQLLLDWPRALELPPDPQTIARLRQAAADVLPLMLAGAARDAIYGVEPRAWLGDASLSTLADWVLRGTTLPARLLQRIERLALDLGRSTIRTMPSTSPETLLGVLPAIGDGDTFARAPAWRGTPVETGPLARRAQHPLVSAYTQRHGNTVAARFVAQLVDLAEWLAATDVEIVHQHEVSPGVGLGLAETARGVLIHQAEVCDGRVQRFRIVAPTEWNFHADGALSQGLVGRPVADAEHARRDAVLLAQALDPCVAFSVEVTDA